MAAELYMIEFKNLMSAYLDHDTFQNFDKIRIYRRMLSPSKWTDKKLLFDE